MPAARRRRRTQHVTGGGMRPRASGSGTVLFPRPGGHERSVVAEALRQETVGGALLLAATVLALALANTPARHAYAHLQHLAVGPASLGLHLSLEEWAADGLLAIFFFVAGLELKREFVAGEMRHVSAAIVPVAAAIGGMAIPVLIDLAFNAGHPTASGWAVPCSTDIAFALAILAVTGRFMPASLRAFLLTLAVVADLGSIIIIAVAYTDHLHVLPMAGAIVLLFVFWLLQRTGLTMWWITIPLAVVVWALVHASGIHAVAAGIALGLLVPVRVSSDDTSPAERLEHLVRPVSAGIAVPVFALLAAGVAVSANSLHHVVTSRLGLGVLLGLLAGKTIGVFGAAYVTARFSRATLSPELTWGDIFAVAVLSGVSFTVSLLISDLAFGVDTGNSELTKTAVLMASALAGLAASALIAIRSAHYRRMQHQEQPATDPARRVSPAASAPDRAGPPWRNHRQR
jgi:Na+:H+ antiporter, NhaA family